MQESVHRLYTYMVPSYIRDLSSKFQSLGMRMRECSIPVPYSYQRIQLYFLICSCACYADAVLWAFKSATVFSM